jgi:hypothetical protein
MNVDFNKHKENLIDIIDMLMCEIEEDDPELYQHIESLLYEDAYGKVVNAEMAHHWVQSMKPAGQHWTMDETTRAMSNLNYHFDTISFYVVANMMYNDYFDLVKDDDSLALHLAKGWLADEDAKECKLYEYWRYVIKR